MSDLSFTHHDDSVGVFCFFGDVGREQDGHGVLLACAIECFPEDPACVDVEPGGGFVEEEDGWVCDECTRQVCSAGEASGEVTNLVIESVLDFKIRRD